MGWALDSILQPLRSFAIGIVVLLLWVFVSLLLLIIAIWLGMVLYVRLFIQRFPGLHRKVAVFGESGSGKTMLLTTFYGHQQAVKFQEANGYGLIAKDADQGTSLLGAYYRLESDLVPPGNRFSYTSYDFCFRVKQVQQPAGLLTWYDYPGGWWNGNAGGDEGQRKGELISHLVKSDVALFLVDGQKYRSKGGNYLLYLFAQFRSELARQRQVLLSSGRRKLGRYPSIWVVCLSKADLFHGYTAETFRKEVLKYADAELRGLREELKSMVKNPDLVSIGEEYLLLSSAEFDPDSQHVKDPTKTIGIDLIAPISLLAPAHHARRLLQTRRRRASVLKRLLAAVQSATVGWMKYLPSVGNLFMLLDDSMKNKMALLEGLEQDVSERGGLVASVAEGMDLRLTAKDAQRVYLGVDPRRE